MHFSLRSLAIILLLSTSSVIAVGQRGYYQQRDVKGQATIFGQDNNEFVDMTAMGDHLSNLQLNMLNKKESDSSQDRIDLSPSNEQMIQVRSNLHQHLHMQQKSRVKSKLHGDDDDLDIAAYSTLNSQSTSTSTDGSTTTPDSDSGSIFASGGAISEALGLSEPVLKEEDKPKPAQPSAAELKKQKEEKEKQKKLAEKKKKEEEEKKKKEEIKRKEEEKKKSEAQAKQSKEDDATLEKQQKLLQSLVDDDQERQKEKESDYFYIKNSPTKSLSAFADINIDTQSEGQVTTDIIAKSRKSLLSGLDGGLF